MCKGLNSWIEKGPHISAAPPRHSGLDPESIAYPVMDPGSKSPHRLGDVRDDVSPVVHARKLAGRQDDATAESSGENAQPVSKS